MDATNTSGIMPVMDMNGGGMASESSWIWVLMLFFLLAWGGNGFWGNNGNGNPATTEDVQNQFNFSALERQNNEIVDAVRTTGANVISTVKDVAYSNLSEIKQAESNITALGYQVQNSTTDINRNIDALKYEQAQQTMTISNAIHAEGEATRALLKEQEISNLRDELSQARGVISNNVQTQNILGQLGTYYTNPPCYGTGCSCGA